MEAKYYALSFGARHPKTHEYDRCNYVSARQRIYNELKNTGVFHDISVLGENYLKDQPEFWNRHSTFIENNRRGYGFWIWKPYIILKTLKRMNENDILFYCDVGCEIMNSSEALLDLKELINKCNAYDIIYTDPEQIEKKWTKMDLINFMGLNNDEIKNSKHVQAGILFLKKNDKIMSLIEDWYNISCSSNYHFINDEPSTSPNDPIFIEHRHDQSIFNMALKSYNNFHYFTKNNLINETNHFHKYSRKRF